MTLVRPRTIALIGLRGSGKTTVGRELAERLGRRFLDLDDVTPRILGCADVADAFATHGEPAFREAEYTAMQDAFATIPGGVVSLGDGTPTAPGVIELLAEHGAAVIYLRAPAATLRERLTDDDNHNRPSLTGHGTLDEIEVIHATRDPLFQRIAGTVLETADLTADEIVELLLAPDVATMWVDRGTP